MSTITREQLHERAREKVKSLEFAVTQTAFADSRAELEEELELARIALASLEAWAVAFRSKLKSPAAIGSERWEYTDHRQPDAFEIENCIVERLYTAPPAPVSVPAAMEMDDDFDSAFEHGKAVGWNAYRAAMLQGAENAESRCTIKTAPALDSLTKNAESRCGNSPVIPEGWVLVPEEPTHEMLEAGDEQFGTYDVYRRMIEAAPKLE